MKYLFPCVPNKLDINAPFFEILDHDQKWIGEVKKNGWRCLAYRDEKGITLYTRRNTIIPDALPNLRAVLKAVLPEGTCIDGELLEKRTKDVKEVFYAFDVLYYRHNEMWNYKWHERRLILESVLEPVGGLIELAEPKPVFKRRLYEENIDRPDVEGIVLKHTDSFYPVGARECPHNLYWLKVKRPEKCQYA